MMPLVSVIMPNYNKGRYIDIAIRSVINQTYPNWELIIVDDGSTDNSRSVIQRYANCNKVKTVFLDRNYGVAHARNIALKEASGDFIAFLDSDDIYRRNKLEMQLSMIDDDEYAVVYSDWFTIDKDNKVRTHTHVPRLAPCEDGYILDLLLGSRGICIATILVPRYLLDISGPFREDTVVAEDMDMLYRLARRFPFFYTPFPLYGYRLLDDSMSNSRSITKNRQKNKKAQIIRDFIKICEREHGFRNYALHRDAYGKYLSYLATTHSWKDIIRECMSSFWSFNALLYFLLHRSWTSYYFKLKLMNDVSMNKNYIDQEVEELEVIM
jgi:glycosyltransferase involved in cell wall biosynthesis